ncbi:uncharacterized protein BDR25DRAFT_344464 [Lindgomyces ingoldianus]|uniref:Uncharacterized protein n=1 Tax=Lindgomyces ingoldianus TaxID=673940 RepID=A0ACB6QPX8_9PLEO|nr:uncharacterized protein BDR25DRAFT_344464 [Lindgomyces ingoldianus]KAF2468170.1 hypothetical protein BDR25DRAFT_344464 [Lindgomyces ingoldianus]
MHKEGFEQLDTFPALMQKLEAKRYFIEDTIDSIVMRREEQKGIHERRFKKLEQGILVIQKSVLPRALALGQDQLLRDAKVKIGETLCGQRAVKLVPYGQRSIALSILYRYAHTLQDRLLAGRPLSDIPPTSTADKCRFAHYLLFAEKGKCTTFGGLRHYLEVLFQWTWGVSIEAAGKTEELCKHHPAIQKARVVAAGMPHPKPQGRPSSLPRPAKIRETMYKDKGVFKEVTRSRRVEGSGFPMSTVSDDEGISQKERHRPSKVRFTSPASGLIHSTESTPNNEKLRRNSAESSLPQCIQCHHLQQMGARWCRWK